MSRQDYERLNDLAVDFEHLVKNIELAENMAGELVCGNITDDAEKERVHIERLWSLMVGLVEVSHLRGKDLEGLLKSVSINEDTPEQSA